MTRKKSVTLGRNRNKQEVSWHIFDVPLLITTIVLLILGVIVVFEASVIDGYHTFGDQLYFVKLQFKWALLGLAGLFTLSSIPITWFRKVAFPSFVCALILLMIVLLPGIGLEVGGAKRWIDLGVFSLQPSEVAKLALILYFSALFEKSAKTMPFLSTLGFVLGLVMLQPDLGTAIVIAVVATTIFFVSGAKITHLLGVLAGGIGTGMLLILTSPYRRARLLTFLNPEDDPLGTSYHIRQIIISLGSGGFWGNGIGRSLQKYRYLPEATTDSVFAVIAEEIGFIGTLIVMGLYIFFAYRGFKIAKNVTEPFLKLVATGITVMILIQAYINLSAMGALVPLTGITLPFISYGGSSLVVSLASVGILLNISRYTQKPYVRKKR